ncbi:MAG: hypothetical protein J5779_03000 [Clostridia bacterium]|nr:hypothetical protein [Clostridia bacterium]
MKKFSLIFILAVFIFALFLVGCGSANNNVSTNLSDVRCGVFDGKNDDLIATFVYGQREQNYAQDGTASPLTDFGIITVNLLKKYDKTQIPFTLKTLDETYSGTLEKSPYNQQYLTDIEKQIKDGTLTLVLSLENEEIEIELNKKSDDFEIDFNQALKIGEDALKDEILNNNSKRMEFQLKLISQNEIEFGKYFWQFIVITEDGNKHFVTFSTSNPEILVKN